MRFLITGGAGFIGGHLTEALIAAGHEVVVADNFSTGSRRNLESCASSPRLRVIELDVVTEKKELRRLISEADMIFHLAAAVGVELVVSDPVRTITTNVQGTENVLRPAADFGKRIIVASTSEVYGKSSHEKFSESDDLVIGSPFHHRWSYASSKLLDEFLLMAFARSAKLPGTVVRFFNTVGPRQTGRYGMVLPRFVGAALKGETLQVYGDGGQSRCFCHVADVIRALFGLIDCPESHGEIYNIGSQRLITIMDLAKLVIAELKSASDITLVPYAKAYAAGFDDMRRRMPDTEKIHRLLDWAPRYSLEEIIADVAGSLR